MPDTWKAVASTQKSIRSAETVKSSPSGILNDRCVVLHGCPPTAPKLNTCANGVGLGDGEGSGSVGVDTGPLSAAATARTSSSIETRPSALASNAGHCCSGIEPSAMPTPLTSSAIVTDPSPLQSPMVAAHSETDGNATPLTKAAAQARRQMLTPLRVLRTT